MFSSTLDVAEDGNGMGCCWLSGEMLGDSMGNDTPSSHAESAAGPLPEAAWLQDDKGHWIDPSASPPWLSNLLSRSFRAEVGTLSLRSV